MQITPDAAGVLDQLTKAVQNERTDPGQQASDRCKYQKEKFIQRKRQNNAAETEQDNKDPADHGCQGFDLVSDIIEQYASILRFMSVIS